jgi:hypothetical protein
MSYDYGDVIARVLQADRKWAEPWAASLQARILFTDLFGEGLKAVSDIRAKGTSMTFGEYSDRDRFDLLANARLVGFERTYDAKVLRYCDGFPPAIVPYESLFETIPVPQVVSEHVGLARSQIKRACELLFRGVDDVLAGRFPAPGTCPHCGHTESRP